MKDGLGAPQSIVLFGGTSDIGLAVVRRLVRPTTSRLVLASRDPARASSLVADLASSPGLEVRHVPFDASDPGDAAGLLAAVADAAGDIDVAVVAQGVLDEGRDVLVDQTGIADTVAVNLTTPMILLAGLAQRMKAQGYGRIVLLSSVAGVRPRRSNPVYGATKSGIDGFALALDHALEGSGVSILVVRPGFVATRMTEGMDRAPFSTTADKVARATARAVSSNARVLWVPSILRFVFGVFRVMPTALWRRLPL